MLDLTVNKMDQEDFITNYYVKNNELFIVYANKEKERFPYTKSLEVNVIETMRYQISVAASHPKLISEGRNKAAYDLFVESTIIAGLAAFARNPEFEYQYLVVIFGLLVGVKSIDSAHILIKRLKQLRETYKLHLWMRNYEEINEALLNDNDNTTLGLSALKRDKLRLNPTIDFHTIDEYTFKDMQIMAMNANYREAEIIEFAKIKKPSKTL